MHPSTTVVSHALFCRCIRDSDLKAVAQHCPDLEQIDILGTNSVKEDGVTRFVFLWEPLIGHSD